MVQYRAGEIAAYTEIGQALRRGGCRCKAPLAVTRVLMDEIAGRMTQDEFFALAIRLTALTPEPCSPTQSVSIPVCETPLHTRKRGNPRCHSAFVNKVLKHWAL